MRRSGLGCRNGVTLNNTGTPLGVHTLKITAAAHVDTVTVGHTVYLTGDALIIGYRMDRTGFQPSV